MGVFLLQVYKAWVNCCLAELGKRSVTDLADKLKDGVILSQLIKSTTGYEIAQCQQVINFHLLSFHM